MVWRDNKHNVGMHNAPIFVNGSHTEVIDYKKITNYRADRLMVVYQYNINKTFIPVAIREKTYFSLASEHNIMRNTSNVPITQAQKMGIDLGELTMLQQYLKIEERY